MARTSASSSTIIFVTILGVFALGGLVGTFVFYGQKTRVQRDLADLQAENNAFVRPAERTRPDLERISDLASPQGMSAISYLEQQRSQAMQLMTGTPQDTVAQARERLAEAGVGEGETVVGVLRSKNQNISALEQRVAGAEAARSAAEQDLAAERERVQRIGNDFGDETERLASRVTQLSDEVDAYRSGITQTEQSMDARVERLQAQASDAEVRLTSRIRQLESDNLALRDTVRRLQNENAGELLSPTDEFALVDGQVAAINAPDNEAYLNLGRNDRIRLGMTFSVYASNVTIAPDAAGNYPRPKGVVEVTRLEDDSATARILSELPGNPILAGDNIANPVYDPNKRYKFIVYGNFDANGDGIVGPFERPQLEDRIREWGGEIVDPTDGLTGDLDFLVLGTRPDLPPQPDGNAPLEIQRNYIRLLRLVDLYDQLFEEARAVGVPVLNQNRLDTLLLGR